MSRLEKEASIARIVVEMTAEKITKGTIRFAEFEPPFDEGGELYQPALKTLYIQKSALAQHFGTAPERIRVTVEKLS